MLYRAYNRCSRTPACPCNNVAMPYIDDAAKAWQLELAKRVGAAVKARRTALTKMTAQQLAERTKELGYPVTAGWRSRRSESNSRAGKVDVAELLVLGAALGVPPVTLIFGGPPDDTVELLPDLTVPFVSALAWFTGDDSLEWSRPDLGLTDPESRNAKLLHLVRDRELKHRDLLMHGLPRPCSARTGTKRLLHPPSHVSRSCSRTSAGWTRRSSGMRPNE